MKRLILLILIISSNTCLMSQVSPTLVYPINSPYNIDLTFIDNERGVMINGDTFIPDPIWIFPFLYDSHVKNNLSTAYYNQSIWGILNEVSIRNSLDSSYSVYVEIASICPSILNINIAKISIGSNVIHSDFIDLTKNIDEIAFQKFTNGGGNVIINFSRPIILFYDRNSFLKPNSFFILNEDLSFYWDIPKLNSINYNPGMNIQSNTNFDFRIYNLEAKKKEEKHPGNLLRVGINGNLEYQLINIEKKLNSNLSDNYNNLMRFSLGGYVGVAMFNIHWCWNWYNKKNPFFENKRNMIRLEIIPVKFSRL